MKLLLTLILCVSPLVFQTAPLAAAGDITTTQTSQTINAEKLLCPDADFWGKKMLTEVCWSCLFPIRLLGMTIFDDSNDIPDGATEKSFCTCDGDHGLPRLGVTGGAWLPARLIEVVRKPYCSPIMGGISFNSGVRLWGGHNKKPRAMGRTKLFLITTIGHFRFTPFLSCLCKTTATPEDSGI